MTKLTWTLNLIAFCVLLAGLTGARAQGTYAPVITADLVGAKFNHYYGANMKAVIPPDFAWTFTATNLTITAAKGPIPQDLLEHLAAGMKDVKRIEAAWKVEGGELVISAIKVNDKPTRTLAKLPAYRTAPTVIRIGKHQYVFSPRT